MIVVATRLSRVGSLLLYSLAVLSTPLNSRSQPNFSTAHEPHLLTTAGTQLRLYREWVSIDSTRLYTCPLANAFAVAVQRHIRGFVCLRRPKALVHYGKSLAPSRPRTSRGSRAFRVTRLSFAGIRAIAIQHEREEKHHETCFLVMRGDGGVARCYIHGLCIRSGRTVVGIRYC